MDPSLSSPTLLLSQLVFFFFFLTGSTNGTTFTFANNCRDTVWPAILANSGSPQLDTTGFELPSGSSRSFQAPTGWSGRFWARTGCSDGPGLAVFCTTGDCGSGEVECNGAGAAPPVTLAEFSLATSSGINLLDFYDVSLVDGYNIAMMVQSSGAGCAAAGCVADLNKQCPPELRVGGDGCRSACEAFGKPEYCCSGAYASPATCRPSVYSEMFKNACPKSYSYAYDDPTSTFTCSAPADYNITFCPIATNSLPASQKSTAHPRATRGGEEMVLENDSWLASLAMGSSNAAAVSLHKLGSFMVISIAWVL